MSNTESSKKTAIRQISDFDHFEIFLCRTAFRTYPVRRDIIPTGPGRETLLGKTVGLAVDKSAHYAHIIFIFTHYKQPRPNPRYEPTRRALYTLARTVKTSRYSSSGIPAVAGNCSQRRLKRLLLVL
jgi:hypothetical protein